MIATLHLKWNERGSQDLGAAYASLNLDGTDVSKLLMLEIEAT